MKERTTLTIAIDKDLLKELRIYVAVNELKLGKLVEEAIKEKMHKDSD